MDDFHEFSLYFFFIIFEPDWSLFMPFMSYVFHVELMKSYFRSVKKYIMVLKNSFNITKPVFDQWNKKLIQDFNEHTQIAVIDNDSHLTSFLINIQIHKY